MRTQSWTSADTHAQIEAIRQIKDLQTRTLQSRLAEDRCHDLEVQLQAEREAHDATRLVLEEMRRKLESQAMDLSVTRRALELRDAEFAKAQREISSLMLQHAGGPLGAPDKERLSSLQARVAALEAELRLKDLQLARQAVAVAAAASASASASTAPRRGPGQVVPAMCASVQHGTASIGAAANLGAGRSSCLRLADFRSVERDFEAASTVVGSSEDDSSASQTGFDAGPSCATGRHWCHPW
mmetsp:Transcript_90131/g.176471  ORF Transcript_90131/g.176471 Transcript_90131/m.176471 type:complete len:242 (-) Transcript_90131:266-991(-)